VESEAEDCLFENDDLEKELEGIDDEVKSETEQGDDAANYQIPDDD